jgi:hypothetical protein
MDEMKWVKLTLLEAGFLRDTLEISYEEDVKIAMELLDGAIDNAVEEEIDGECIKVPDQGD